jgi:hypothetical protein
VVDQITTTCDRVLCQTHVKRARPVSRHTPFAMRRRAISLSTEPCTRMDGRRPIAARPQRAFVPRCSEGADPLDMAGRRTGIMLVRQRDERPGRSDPSAVRLAPGRRMSGITTPTAGDGRDERGSRSGPTDAGLRATACPHRSPSPKACAQPAGPAPTHVDLFHSAPACSGHHGSTVARQARPERRHPARSPWIGTAPDDQGDPRQAHGRGGR